MGEEEGKKKLPGMLDPVLCSRTGKCIKSFQHRLCSSLTQASLVLFGKQIGEGYILLYR